jgi:hypothetical protein
MESFRQALGAVYFALAEAAGAMMSSIEQAIFSQTP